MFAAQCLRSRRPAWLILCCAVLPALSGCDRLLEATADWRVHPLPLVTDCRLERESCRAPLPGSGWVEIRIAPRPVLAAHPLTLEVVVTGQTPLRVDVDFAGADMNMGVNRTRLHAVGDQRYRGETTLPACISGRMLWKATVRLDTGFRVWALPFLLETAGH